MYLNMTTAFLKLSDPLPGACKPRIINLNLRYRIGIKVNDSVLDVGRVTRHIPDLPANAVYYIKISGHIMLFYDELWRECAKVQ